MWTMRAVRSSGTARQQADPPGATPVQQLSSWRALLSDSSEHFQCLLKTKALRLLLKQQFPLQLQKSLTQSSPYQKLPMLLMRALVLKRPTQIHVRLKVKHRLQLKHQLILKHKRVMLKMLLMPPN